MGPLPMLLLTSDQDGAGWAAAHFLAAPWTGHGHGGLNLLVDFVPDPFHRSWNDFKYALRHASGGLVASQIQLTVIYNTNYQPFLNAANMGKKRELAQEYRLLFPGADVEFEDLLEHIALDARQAHAAEAGAVEEAYDLALSHENFQKKDMYVRSSAWYSIVAAAAHYDTSFSAWRYTMRGIAKHLLRGRGSLAKLVERIASVEKEAVTVHGTAQQESDRHKAEVAALKKTSGDQLVLSAMLMHNRNFFNSRLILLVGRFLLSEQTILSTVKVTAEQSAARAVALAGGCGEQFLRAIWTGATFDAEEWARLGCRLTSGAQCVDMSARVDPLFGLEEPGVLEQDIPGRSRMIYNSCKIVKSLS